MLLLTKLITNYLCSITVLIREYVILTINWQWSGGTVAVEQSRSVAQILDSCLQWQGFDSSDAVDQMTNNFGQVN